MADEVDEPSLAADSGPSVPAEAATTVPASETEETETEETEETEEAAEATSFWGEIRSRMIIGTPMDAGVRVTFLLGALTLVVAMGVDVVRSFLGPPVTTLAGVFPLGALAVYAIGQFVVFTLYFSALLQVKRHTRNIALAITALVVFATPALQDFRPFDFVLLLPLAGVWVFGDTKDQLVHGAALKPAAIAAAAMSLVFVVAGLFGQDVILIEQSGGAAIIAAVGLFLASTDIAEIVQVGGDAVAERLRSVSAPLLALAVCVAALLSCVVSADILAQHGIDAASIASALGTGVAPVVWFGLVYWMIVSVGRKRALIVRPHVPYLILLIVVIGCGLAFYGGVLARFLADPATYDPAHLLGYDQVKDVGILLFLFFTIAFLTRGRGSEHAFVLYGYGASVSVIWFIDFSTSGDTIVVVPFGVALVSLLVVVIAFLWPKTRDRFADVCELLIATNLAFAGYALLAAVFMGAPTTFEEGSLLQALIVIVALGWDVLTSGHVTLRESPALPRPARVSFFVAYICLVALLVMMSSAASFVIPGTTTPVEHVFESEGFVAVGLHLFGAPMLLFLFAVRMRAMLGAPPRERKSKHEPAATDPAATDPAATDPAATDPAATDPAANPAPIAAAEAPPTTL